MINLLKTDSDNSDFQKLSSLLDADLKIRDGEEHAFYSQFNKIANIKNVIVAYEDKSAVACGAFKYYSEDTVEIKRMYVRVEYRGRGIAKAIITELEKWAAESGYSNCVLETGKNQPEAINLYEKEGFSRIPNYGQYVNVPNSVCMKKVLK
jgi:putative acetyltransferase